MSELRIERVSGGFVFGVKVVPGSSRTTAAGLFGDLLKVKVAAAPEKGKANKCLIEFLSEIAGVKRSDITIIAGQRSAVKQVTIRTGSVDSVVGKLLGE